MKYLWIDFEFNKSKEKYVTPVCVSYEDSEGNSDTIWLHNNLGSQINFSKLLKEKYKDHTIVSYSNIAEARSFESLQVNYNEFQWIDLFLEYLCLSNHNHNICIGKQLIDGKEVVIQKPKPKWERTEEDSQRKAKKDLAAALYKLLGVKIDNEFKKATRDLIISAPEEFTDEEQEQIMNYCASDVKFLKPLFYAIVKEYRRLLKDKFNAEQLKSEMFIRSKYALASAKMESTGYPIDVEATKNFSDSVEDMLFACKNEINQLFPDIKPFKLDTKTLDLTMNTKAVQKWILDWQAKTGRKWIMTEKRGPSLSDDAFKEHFQYRHEYPKDSFPAQIIRYLNLKTNLNGFMPKKKVDDKNFWSYVGSDGFVRPYMGIYVAQSSRSQPSASGFIPLKSAWMRSFIRPPSGYCMGGIDFASQEFLIAALLSNDPVMIKAYESGDVYLYFAKVAGAVPWDGTLKEYKAIRNKFKSAVLGIMYGMEKWSLGAKLTEDTGEYHSENDGQRFIDDFNKAFKVFYAWKQKSLARYRMDRHLKLPCGWYMWGDNINDKSILNCPVQGFGASVMRLAVIYAQEAGLTVPYTLHDAVYLLSRKENIKHEMKILAECMDKAFRYYFPDHIKPKATIRLEADIWGYGENLFTEIPYLSYKMPVKIQDIYIDERGEKEYFFFKKYFEKTTTIDEELIF